MNIISIAHKINDIELLGLAATYLVPDTLGKPGATLSLGLLPHMAHICTSTNLVAVLQLHKYQA